MNFKKIYDDYLNFIVFSNIKKYDYNTRLILDYINLKWE
jgi:hypothetical protein